MVLLIGPGAVSGGQTIGGEGASGGMGQDRASLPGQGTTSGTIIMDNSERKEQSWEFVNGGLSQILRLVLGLS